MSTTDSGPQPPITIFSPTRVDFTTSTATTPIAGVSLPADILRTEQRAPASLSRSGDDRRPGPPSDTPDLAGLLRALRRRWKLAVAGSLVFGLLAAVAVLLLLPPPKYTTSALVFVAATRPKEIFETRESSVAYSTYQETQLALAGSRMVMEAALKQDSVATLASVVKQADPIDWLGSEIKVDFPRGSEIFRISMTGAYPPKDVEILVNAVTDAYMNGVVEQECQERNARFERLKTLLEDLQKDLRRKREDYKNAAEVVGASNKQNAAIKQQMLIEHLGQARQELLRLGSDLRNAQARLKILQSRQEEVQDATVDISSNSLEQRIESDTEVMQLRGRLTDLDHQLQSFRRTARKPNDPAIFRANQEIAQFKKDLEHRLKSLRRTPATVTANPSRTPSDPQLAGAQQYFDILKEQERAVRDEVAVLQGEMSSLNIRSMDFHWLEDEITLATETARTVGTEVQAMSVELKAPPRIRLIEKAKAPFVTDPKRKLRYTAGATIAVVCGYLGLLSFWEYQARRIASPDEVVEGLGLKLVGSLPSLAGPRRAGGEVVQQRLLVDSIDAIRTMLLAAARYEPLRILMVTSALKGEAKTSLSCHLAASLARAGRKTLLIDCDLRRPSVHAAFSAPPAPGVGEYLRGEVVLDEAVWQSPVPSLSLIPAGVFDSATTELLARDRFHDLFAALRGRFDFIVVDSAPVLLATDSLIVSQHVDAVIFSILRNVSQVPPVHAAYEQLTALGIRIFGAVMSGVDRSTYGDMTYSYLHEATGHGPSTE